MSSKPPGPPGYPELTAAHAPALQRLIAGGFAPARFPLYPNTVGVQRDGFAALLTPYPGGELRILGEPCRLIDGNLAVRVEREGQTFFVWKKRQVFATEQMMSEFKRFVADLTPILLPPAPPSGTGNEP